jgi:cytochrome c oxidase subunit I+III
MAMAVETSERDQRAAAFERVWAEPRGLTGHLRTINNIPVAHRYLVAAFVFFLAGGVQALLMRVQLSAPERRFLDAETYNQLFTMHGTTMMFLFVIPFTEALANYMLPLLLGTRDLPFPRLTALSYWTYVFGGIFLYSSFLFDAAPDGGWFAYVPLTSKEFSPGLNLDFWDIGLSVAEVAAIGAAAELIVGILRMRAPGMTLFRMPIFAWALLVTAVMIVFAFTPLIVGTAMLELDRKGLTRFFDPAAGGDPLLWQHLFWVFGHPEVYIMFLPAVGVVSHVVQTFSRRPLVGYGAIVASMIAVGVISFGLWVHHMFATGMSETTMAVFAAASFLIAIPSGVQVFCWLATMWLGRPRWTTPMLFVAGFIALFVFGGITGVMVAAVAFDTQAHDSYFVVAHFHYVLIGGVVFPLFAGLYYWLPKITGRLMSEGLGRWNFWVMFVAFNVTFFPMHLSGLLGMPRRVYTYPEGLGWDLPNLISTLGALGFAAGVLLFVANFFWSRARGAPAGPNPWESDTLEWSESSPPAEAQFPLLPVVRSRHPLWEQRSLRPEDRVTAETLRPLDAAPTRWRGGLCVSMVDARPLALVHLPGPSIWPFILAVGFVLLFSAALVDSAGLALAGGGVTLVALAGWFRPSESETVAIQEIAAKPVGSSLPLAVAGPLSNGWWGVLVAVLVLVVALITLLGSHVYLTSGGRAAESADLSETLLGVGAVGIAVALGGATWWMGRDPSAAGLTRRRFGLALGTLLDIVLLIVLALLYGYRGARFTREIDAEGSLFFILIVFQALVTLAGVVMLVVAQIWTWHSPSDPRSLAASTNAAPVNYFVVASWMLIFATLYLLPRVV